MFVVLDDHGKASLYAFININALFVMVVSLGRV